MAPTFQKVQPGDLITAEMMNSIVDELNSLEQRLGALEAVGVGSGKVIITDIPLVPPPRVNQTLDIFGQNFGFTIGAQQVTFDQNIPVGAFLAGSNDTRLVVRVPVIPNIPPAGRPVLVEVRNLTSSDSRSVHILPLILTTEGPVDVNFVSVEPTTIQPNAAATFKYHLKSRATLLADFLVTPEITGMTNNSTVQAQLQVLGPNQVNIPSKQISLAPNEEKDIFIRIPTVPAGSANVSFKLKVTLAAENAGGFDGPRDFTVGQVVVLPDPSIVFSFLEPKLFLSPAAGASLDKTTQPFTIKLVTPTAQVGSLARISIQAAMHFPDTYNASSAILSGTNWNTSVNTGLVPNPLILTESDFAGGTNEVTKELRFVVNPSVGASNTASVELKLKRNGSTASQTMRFNLALV